MSTNTINLDLIDDPAQVREAIISGTPTPGMLVEYTSAVADTVQAHGTAGGINNRMFLLENTANAGLISDAYTATERGRVMFARKGQKVNTLLVDEGNITRGDLLISDGAGALKADAGTETGLEIVGEAAETVDNTGGSGVVRIKIIVW